MDINENKVHPLSLQYLMLWSVVCTTRSAAGWWPFTVWPGSPRHMPHRDLCPTNATQPAPGLAAANRSRDGTRPHRLLIGIGLCGIVLSDPGIYILLMGLLPDTYNCGLRMRRECRERNPRHRLKREPLVSEPSMHHGTCVTHMPWCMSGSLTRDGEENVPSIPCACVTSWITTEVSMNIQICPVSRENTVILAANIQASYRTAGFVCSLFLMCSLLFDKIRRTFIKYILLYIYS